jgi:hypothetical protein
MVHNPMVFGVFRVVQPSPQSTSGQFTTSKEGLHPLAATHHFCDAFLLCPEQPPTSPLCVPLGLSLLAISYKWNHTKGGALQMFSLISVN